MRSPSRRRAEQYRRIGPAAGIAFGGLVLVAAARGLNAAPLLLPGIGLVLLAWMALAWASVAALGAGVRRSVVPARVIEGEEFPVRLEVDGRYLAAAELIVHDPLTRGGLRVPRRRRRRGRPAAPRTVTLSARAGRRGRQLLPAPRLVIGDPLGLVQVMVAGAGDADEVLVLPLVERVQWSAGRRGRLGGDQGATREPTGAGEVDGLREYRPGTPATRIHWPALARGVGLHERRMVAAHAAVPMVVLDPRCEDSDAGLRALDATVRATASIVRELAAIGGCTVLLPGARLPLAVGQDLRAWPGVHSRLALVEPEFNLGRGPALRVDQLGGPLVYVASSRALELPALRRHLPRSLLVAPVTDDDPIVGASFEVAGCRAYPAAPRALRRAA